MQADPRDERRKQIMEAALPVFAANGFHGTSNRAIASAAGIAPGLIYWYFKNKEDLFTSILDTYAPFGRIAIPFAALAEVPPQIVLPRLVARIAELMNDRRTLLAMRLLIAETITNPDAGQRLNGMVKSVLDPLADYLRGQIARGVLRDGEALLMAQTAISMTVFFLIRRVVGQDADLLAYAIDDFSTFLVATFMAAYGA